jgi:hypothetical protein
MRPFIPWAKPAQDIDVYHINIFHATNEIHRIEASPSLLHNLMYDISVKKPTCWLLTLQVNYLQHLENWIYKLPWKLKLKKCSFADSISVVAIIYNFWMRPFPYKPPSFVCSFPFKSVVATHTRARARTHTHYVHSIISGVFTGVWRQM